jgi:SSS family solute:Na+ symporter
MSVAFLFAVLWKKTSEKAINLVLSLGTVFSIGVGLLWYQKLIPGNLHFLYISFLIFVVLSVFTAVFSLFDMKKTNEATVLGYSPIKIPGKVKIAWGVLVVIMIGLYWVFN